MRERQGGKAFRKLKSRPTGKNKPFFLTPSDVRPIRPTRFSFEFAHLDHDIFDASGCESEYWTDLVKTLSVYERWSIDQFMNEYNDDSRHRIDFDLTVVPNGFPHADADQTTAMSIALGSAQTSHRVYGYHSNGIFYLVWFDHKHCLYRRTR